MYSIFHSIFHILRCSSVARARRTFQRASGFWPAAIAPASCSCDTGAPCPRSFCKTTDDLNLQRERAHAGPKIKHCMQECIQPFPSTLLLPGFGHQWCTQAPVAGFASKLIPHSKSERQHRIHQKKKKSFRHANLVLCRKSGRTTLPVNCRMPHWPCILADLQEAAHLLSLEVVQLSKPSPQRIPFFAPQLSPARGTRTLQM